MVVSVINIFAFVEGESHLTDQLVIIFEAIAISYVLFVNCI